MPYVTESFKKEYLIPYYIGETLFGVIPSFLAIVQGVGDDATCHNVTIGNITSLEVQEPVPIFSVSNYFRIIFVFLAFSSLAFILINCLDLDRHRHTSQKKKTKKKTNNEQIADDKTTPDETSNKLIEPTAIEKDEEEEEETGSKKLENTQHSAREKLILFALNFLITFFYYGILPGIQSYSTIPYGSNVFHLSINLSNSIFFQFF